MGLGPAIVDESQPTQPNIYACRSTRAFGQFDPRYGIMHIVGPDDTACCSAARAPARMFTSP